MASRFVDAGSVDEFISEKENKGTAQKTLRDVKLFQLFLVTKNEDRNIEDIPTGELNEYMSDFIISVRTKDGREYEPSSLRSLLAIARNCGHWNAGIRSRPSLQVHSDIRI